MREALRAHRSALHTLHMIVADSGGGLQTSGDIGVMNDVALFGAMRPHAREAIRLEFEIDGKRVSLRWILTGKLPHLLFDAENVLHMVAKLMRDNIGLRKVGIAATETFQLIPETEVDVDLLVRRTIERTGLRLGGAAAGVRVVVVRAPALRVDTVFPSARGEEWPTFFAHHPASRRRVQLAGHHPALRRKGGLP